CSCSAFGGGPRFATVQPGLRNRRNDLQQRFTMALLKVTSPHAHRRTDTGHIMRLVIIATLPGMLTLTAFFGIGVIHNVLLACFTCALLEAAVMKMRGRPAGFYLRDYSALVTGVLLGLALPPYCPWWLVIVGCICAI